MFHIVWILCWFIASVDWAVAFNRLKSVIDSYFNDLENTDCGGSSVDVLDESRDLDIYVQAAIAVVSCIPESVVCVCVCVCLCVVGEYVYVCISVQNKIC